MNLGADLGVAIRELQTASGPVDYALFVGRRLCGVIEAKSAGVTLSGSSDQAARYIADLPRNLVREAGQVRFEYVASGSETLFRDHADPNPTSRRLFAFHRPETLERWLGEAVTLRGRLSQMPPVITDGLRECQIDAVSALEVSMAQNRPRALVQLATGAGKTFTACTLSYRLTIGSSRNASSALWTARTRLPSPGTSASSMPSSGSARSPLSPSRLRRP